MRVKDHRLYLGNAAAPFVKSPNVGGRLEPRFLIIHYTASGPASDMARYFSNASARVSAHLVVRRDGTVTQCVPFDTIAWHAGESRWTDRSGKSIVGLNSCSIGIEIENWGPLRRTGAGWISWTGRSVDEGKVIEARHKFGSPSGGWEVYTEEQVRATMQVCQALYEAYPLMEDILGHDDIAPGRKSDPGPAWSMSSFKASVLGRSASEDGAFVVNAASGLNIRTGAGASHPLVRKDPLPAGTLVLVHEAEGNWRFVSVLDATGEPDFSGWVHGGFLRRN